MLAPIEDIFTPFKIVSNSFSKAEELGVGLTLCKAAIKAHGARALKLKSKDEIGAQFSIQLPIDAGC
ncbi:MAG: hypothetical protein DGJ47_001118 [Rickettsiaceae bacterium]